MNEAIFKDIFKFYKKNYKRIEKEEIYKWEAVDHFQKTWNIDSSDFAGMIKESLSKTRNLMSSGQYFAKKMILWLAEKESEKVRDMFKELFDLSIDFKARVQSFMDSAEKLVVKHKEGTVSNHYQDHRAVMVYLNLMFPEKYYLYKFTMFKVFVKTVDYDIAPKSGDIENLFKFDSLCNLILNKVKADKELMEMYEPRKTKFHDPEYHLLVQDIIYAAQYYSGVSELESDNEVIKPSKFSLKAVKKPIVLKGNFVDFMEKNKKLKLIGNLGEEFIYQQERTKVKSYHLAKSKKVEWIARDKGDGLGYDILSWDKNGNEKYIEVKTTTGKEKISFYITANELAKSEEDSEHYYLYRVYNFNIDNVKGDYSERKGSLSDLCISAQTFKVNFE